MHSISKNLKLIRQQRGWTQQQMADVLFVTRQTVSNWENGKSMPDLNMLTDISEKLNVDVNVLLYGYQKNDADIRNNMIVSGMIVLFTVVSYLWLIPYISKICNVTFCSFDAYILYLITFPLFSFAAARWGIQVAKFKNIIPSSIKLTYGKQARKIIRISITVYAVLLLPYIIYEFMFFIVSFSVVVMKISTGSPLFSILSGLQKFAGSILQTMFKIPFYSKIIELILIFMYSPNFIAMWLFAFIGGIYELSEPVKTKVYNSEKETSDSSQ